LIVGVSSWISVHFLPNFGVDQSLMVRSKSIVLLIASPPGKRASIGDGGVRVKT
jgi:hypothetical protein